MIDEGAERSPLLHKIYFAGTIADEFEKEFEWCTESRANLNYFRVKDAEHMTKVDEIWD